MMDLKENALGEDFMKFAIGAAILGSTPFSASLAQDMAWTTTTLGTGIKPAIAIDANDSPHVSFLIEDFAGAVFYATPSGEDWVIQNVAQGYFYGPVDIDVTADGTPFVVYHDHQDQNFNPVLGAGVVHTLNNGVWQTDVIEDGGHDQWDIDVAADTDGNWHFAGVDPIQFGSQDGIEYGTNAYGDTIIEQIGSGPILYEFGVSIEVAPDGAVGLTYFDTNTQDLIYATRTPGREGQWTLETVASEGDSGRYSDLHYDADGVPHISYFQFEPTFRSGTVMYATKSDGTWVLKAVNPLNLITPGRFAARKVTNIDQSSDGSIVIMSGDAAEILYASQVDDGWSVSQAYVATGRELGQIVEFALDGSDRPHAVFHEVDQIISAGVQGEVIYLTGRPSGG